MRKLLELLRLHFDLKLSQRQIAGSTNLGQSTVNDYLARFTRAGLSWPLPAELSEAWTAFKKGGKEAMVMGDLVLTEDEVSPVMQKLEDGGIEITALHNHLLHESPGVMYMHIGGMGDPVKMAQTISAALSLTRTPSESGGGQESAQIGLDRSKIEQTVGHKGKVKGGVLQFSIPRAKPTIFQPVGSDSLTGGASIPNSMGVAQAINFQPTDNGKAAITGDFVLIAKEVNPVIRALRANGIEITALHSHMLEDQPHLFFTHFWANDDPAKLATGIRAALDKIDKIDVKKGQ